MKSEFSIDLRECKDGSWTAVAHDHNGACVCTAATMTQGVNAAQYCLAQLGDAIVRHLLKSETPNVSKRRKKS